MNSKFKNGNLEAKNSKDLKYPDARGRSTAKNTDCKRDNVKGKVKIGGFRFKPMHEPPKETDNLKQLTAIKGTNSNMHV